MKIILRGIDKILLTDLVENDINIHVMMKICDKFSVTIKTDDVVIMNDCEFIILTIRREALPDYIVKLNLNKIEDVIFTK